MCEELKEIHSSMLDRGTNSIDEDEDKYPELERKNIEETKAAMVRNEKIYQVLISDWLKEEAY